ncbi:MAG: carboxypeptidase-like regulatory domain-containing protein [Flavisolibacter sp.]
MRYFLLLILLTAGVTAHAQKRITGVIIDAETKAPVPKASIFINNSSIGTTANEDGKFALLLPAGKFELIISSVGYQTRSILMHSNEADAFITIALEVKSPELETVIVEPFEKDGWRKWGRWFIENFLGTSSFSKSCKLENHEVLKFRHSTKNNTMTVFADAPLVIENSALGYRITYQLESFAYDFKNQFLLYTGYPFFEMLKGNERRQRKWMKAREEVFYGSMLHFMRALYRNRVVEEGYAVQRLKKIRNQEKDRVRMVYKTSMQANENGVLISTINSDSSAYFDNVMSQNDYFSVVEKAFLTGDSIAYAVDSTTAGMDFENYLLITYKNKNATTEFLKFYPSMTSEITLINGKPLEILANGSYYNPVDLMSTGYWAWSEKVGSMLPFDYYPGKQ